MKPKVVTFLKIRVFRVLRAVIDCVIFKDFDLFIDHLKGEIFNDFVDVG
jgi:hypothetical protein